jgi:hypothetical protein
MAANGNRHVPERVAATTINAGHRQTPHRHLTGRVIING